MIFRLLTIAIPFIWFGMVGGISFLEAPLKFQAPGITLGLGLGIGRIVFGVLNKVEIAFALLMTISFVIVRPVTVTAKVILGIVTTILLLQTVWLLPVLDVRAQQVIDGMVPPASVLHIVYIVLEAVKFVLLFTLGTVLVKLYLRLAK